ncbi:glycosyltransferase family 2 protein [Aliiglaciecola sp. 3_MG-2023]|uniref:glycosyltransferase family 2 protein n=1 Tax=Aliiglaciecola sp. 3_MG-2023 TaxID=3062644 RepID=UPI0026E345F0|nr:glycosyltransferase family 2 protein [Aliiglaciecola sp. 3_MG-2023]MDO6691860.1 glycosyltransferase family 2 protein [Aliiglaciecola sp. 3_MG-2023]
MKLIVQIPCYNEEHTLPATFNDIPKTIEGIDQVEIMIIDDGSKDRTIEVAKELGVDHIVINKNNRGLARTFRKGIDECLKRGADIIVNTDGDNQYAGWDIPKLIQPILDRKADVVVGDRRTGQIDHFSGLKKFLQRLGSFVVRQLSGVDVPDAVSGFRAYSREAALQLNIVSPFSYTIEALIQAGKKHMAVTSVPVETNEKTRESRLFTSIPKFIERQLTTIVRMYTMYQPLKVFFIIAVTLSVLGIIPIIRFLFFYFTGDGSGHIQSLILGGALTILGFITFLIALLADLINFNRQLVEQTLEKVRRLELEIKDQTKDKK